MVQQSHINSSRAIMINHQFTHMVNIRDPESPLVKTGFEDPLASFSSMNERADNDYEIVAKFEKNPYSYVLIGYDKKHNRFHAWKRCELEKHAESFSTRYNNEFLDSMEIGDKIKKGDIVVKSDSFDKHMKYRFGKNLNTVYLVSAQVLEDGILLMNGAENLMTTYRVYTITINLADNEILINWYGDDDHYQGLPDIGEKVKKGILAAVRRVDNSKAPYALKKKHLRHLERGDRRYIVSGRVIDTNIKYNKERSRMVDVGANKMILDMYDRQQDYYHKLYKYMHAIVDDVNNMGYTYTPDFSAICAEAEEYIDSSSFFADNNDNVFGNMQITITLMDEEKLIVGSKMVGRSGNKGVISQIRPMNESWHMEDGTPIHVVVATLGIVGRLNQAQMNEHSINELGSTAVEMMKLTDDVDKKGKIMYDLMMYLNSDQAHSFKKWFKDLNHNDKVKYCKRVERNGIEIFQDPIENANMLDIGKAYEHFPPKWQRIVFPDGKKSMRKVLCAKMFYMRLKQDPLEKYSARSRGPVNPLTTLPAKSNNKKKFLEPFSDVAVRFGEQELEVLLGMCNHPAAVADFMMENSTSWEAKVMMALQGYLGDPDDLADFDWSDFNLELSGKKNAEAIAGYMNMFGSEVVFTVIEAPEGEWFSDDE